MINYETLSELNCILLPAKIEFCHDDFLEHHESIYPFWHNIITNALREEKNNHIANSLSSEPFLENDEVVALFNKNEITGIFMFRWINMQYNVNRELHALQKRFPKNILDTLIKHRKMHLMLMGQLAVHPNWRKSTVGTGISDLLMYFAVTRFLESKADTLMTTTRNNRNTNALCYRQGGRKATSNEKVFGVESDVVLFDRTDVTSMKDEKLRTIGKQLWTEKQTGWIDIPLPFIENRD